MNALFPPPERSWMHGRYGAARGEKTRDTDDFRRMTVTLYSEQP